MADFDDFADPVLGAACNRLAAYTLPIPEGALIDEASGLTEPDLILILRALHRARHSVMIRRMSMDEMNEEIAKPIAAARAMSDADLLRAHQEQAAIRPTSRCRRCSTRSSDELGHLTKR